MDNKVLQSIQEADIDTDKALTCSTIRGGAVTFVIWDAIVFIHERDFSQEAAYLQSIVETGRLSEKSLENFLRHFMYSADVAKRFVGWQRGLSVCAAVA